MLRRVWPEREGGLREAQLVWSERKERLRLHRASQVDRAEVLGNFFVFKGN